MRFTSEQHLDDGVLEREFTLGEIPGILWTLRSASAPAPLILLGHPGGLRRMYPRLAARARHAVAEGYAAAGLAGKVVPYVREIGTAYRTADLVLSRAGALTWEASLWRLCIAPLLAVLLALLLGVRDEPLGVLFLLLASPVAASSHVMVVAARGDGTLAANIVVLTTLLSLLTITFGFFLLSVFSLVGQLR